VGSKPQSGGLLLQVDGSDSAYTQMASAAVQFLNAPRVERFGSVDHLPVRLIYTTLSVRFYVVFGHMFDNL
jgi:hypothetical protein